MVNIVDRLPLSPEINMYKETSPTYSNRSVGEVARGNMYKS